MKTIRKINFRVEVYPQVRVYGRILNSSECKAICNKVKNQIMRHVEEIDSAVIMFDSEAVCSYCGCIWSEEGNNYNGGCCSKDEYDGEKRLKENLDLMNRETNEPTQSK